MKAQILKDLKSLITRMSDEAHELDKIKDDIEKLQDEKDDPGLEDFSDDEIADEYDFRSLGDKEYSKEESIHEKWKDELWEEHKHKFILEEIETFLTSK